MNIKSIKTKEEHAWAVERLSQLWDANTKEEQEEFDLLSDLIEAYERRNFPTPKIDPIEAIKFRMEQLNMNSTQLAKYLGYKSRVSEILSGKRGLTLSMINILHHKLGIPAESLIGPPLLAILMILSCSAFWLSFFFTHGS